MKLRNPFIRDHAKAAAKDFHNVAKLLGWTTGKVRRYDESDFTGVGNNAWGVEIEAKDPRGDSFQDLAEHIDGIRSFIEHKSKRVYGAVWDPYWGNGKHHAVFWNRQRTS